MEEEKFSKSIFIKSIVLAILVTAVVASMITIIILNNIDETDLMGKITDKLTMVEKIIDNDYLGDIDENEVLDWTIKGYVYGLDDEYSQYFTKDELEHYFVKPYKFFINHFFFLAKFRNNFKFPSSLCCS